MNPPNDNSGLAAGMTDECSHAWPNMVRYLDQKCMSCGIARTDYEGAKQLKELNKALSNASRVMTGRTQKLASIPDTIFCRWDDPAGGRWAIAPFLNSQAVSHAVSRPQGSGDALEAAITQAIDCWETEGLLTEAVVQKMKDSLCCLQSAINAEVISIEIAPVAGGKLVSIDGETRWIKESDFRTYKQNLKAALGDAALSAPPVDVNARLLKALEPFAREARLIDGSLDKGLPDTARIAGTEALTVGDLRRAAIAASDGGG